MFSPEIMSSKNASNNPGLCPVEGQKSGLYSRTVNRNLFSSLTLDIDKTNSHCHMLVMHSTFYFSSYILPRDPPRKAQVQLTVSCELVNDLISSYPKLPRDAIQPHSVPGRLLTLRIISTHKYYTRAENRKLYC
jgi:hypothetical protein